MSKSIRLGSKNLDIFEVFEYLVRNQIFPDNYRLCEFLDPSYFWISSREFTTGALLFTCACIKRPGNSSHR